MSTHDDNLYSRQIGAVGKNTMDKLMNLKICIIGVGPVGQETIKCLSLIGINKLYIISLLALHSQHSCYLIIQTRDNSLNRTGITLSFTQSSTIIGSPCTKTDAVTIRFTPLTALLSAFCCIVATVLSPIFQFFWRMFCEYS